MTLDGDEYMKVRHVSLLPDIGDMELYASNLFTGSEELSKYSVPLPPPATKRHLPQITSTNRQ